MNANKDEQQLVEQRILHKMKELSHLTHNSLLVYAASVTIELRDKDKVIDSIIGEVEKHNQEIEEDYRAGLNKMTAVGKQLGEAQAASMWARKAVAKKLANDPKQQDKTFIFGCWQQWQKSPATYATKAAFARDMLTKIENLKSQKKIEDWCREWEKTHPAG